MCYINYNSVKFRYILLITKLSLFYIVCATYVNCYVNCNIVKFKLINNNKIMFICTIYSICYINCNCLKFSFTNLTTKLSLFAQFIPFVTLIVIVIKLAALILQQNKFVEAT